MPLKKYRQTRDEALEEAAEAYRTNPADAEVASNFIQTLIGWRQRDTFVEASQTLESANRNVIDNLLLLAAAHGAFYRSQDEERCLRAALQLEDRPEIRWDLALNLILQRRSTEAIPFMQHLFEQEGAAAVPGLQLLVRGLQQDGHHDEALGILTRIEQTFPDALDEKEFARLRKDSEKHRATGKRIRHKDLELKPPKDKNTSGCLTAFPLLVPLFFLVIFVSLGVDSSGSAEIYLVNGVGQPYNVTIEGRQYTLSPGSRLKTSVSTGSISLTYANAVGEERTRTLELEGGFFSWLDNNLTLVNPDLCAIVLWEETVYSQTPEEDYEPAARVQTGQLVHTHQDIDFKFVPFPDQIETSSDRVFRQRLSLLDSSDPTLALAMYLVNHSGEERLAFVKNRLDFHPGDAVSLKVLELLEKDSVPAK
ncbi:MAG: hypothetical protein QNK37_16620 [Acidobacteriota bacterium]|nr:hypothetical protein [Acidobacteriota bacterium]